MNDFLMIIYSLFRFENLSLHCSVLTEVVLQMLPGGGEDSCGRTTGEPKFYWCEEAVVHTLIVTLIRATYL